MRRREFITLLSGAALSWPVAARAQNTAPRLIGFLHSGGPEGAPHIAAGFRRGLRDTGFIDGQNVRIEYRWAHGQYDQLPALAKELVRIPVSVLVAGGGVPAVLAAKSATSTIPIVFAMSGDGGQTWLGYGINRPGANATGIDILATTLDPKRLSLLHDLVPSASTIGYLVNATYTPSASSRACEYTTGGPSTPLILRLEKRGAGTLVPAPRSLLYTTAGAAPSRFIPSPGHPHRRGKRTKPSSYLGGLRSRIRNSGTGPT